MVLTVSDVSLPDFEIDFSNFLIERTTLMNLPAITIDLSEENAIAEQTLKNLNAEFDESNARESEARREVDNLSSLCTDRLNKLESITSSMKELETRIRNIEDGQSKEELESLEIAKKTLNMYKRLIKLKWLHSSSADTLECVIFNDKNAFLKYVKFAKSDPLIAEKVWTEISQARESSWMEVFERN